MKKLSTVITTIALSASFLVCAGIGVTSATNAFDKEPVQAEAAGTVGTSDGRLFLDFTDSQSNGWWDAGAVMFVYFYGDGGNAWSDNIYNHMVENNIFSVTIPEGNWTGCNVVRCKNGTTSGNWDDRWNQTQDISFNSNYNKIKLYGFNGIYSYYAYDSNYQYFLSGQSVFLDLNNNTDWKNLNKNYYMHFYDGNGRYADPQLTMVQGFDNGNTNLYETIVPNNNDTYGVWGKTMFYCGSNVGEYTRKTGDVGVNISKNVYKMGTNWEFDWNYSPESRAHDLGTYTKSQLGAHCGENYSSTNSASTFSAAWSNLKAQWNSMSDAEHTQYVALLANESSTNDYEVGVYYYDYCVKRYFSSDNFAGRAVKSLIFSPSTFDPKSKDYTAIIIVVSAVSLLAASGLLYLKFRKKEQ